jgi:hypothetical protein
MNDAFNEHVRSKNRIYNFNLKIEYNGRWEDNSWTGR